MRKAVLKDLPVTVDEDDTLPQPSGVCHPGWNDIPADSIGFVAVDDLRRALVHGAGTFSRRMKDYRVLGFIKIRELADRNGYVQVARINDKGAEIAKLLWERYSELAARLLARVPQTDLESHCRVDEAISAARGAKPRNPWEGMNA